MAAMGLSDRRVVSPAAVAAGRADGSATGRVKEGAWARLAAAKSGIGAGGGAGAAGGGGAVAAAACALTAEGACGRLPYLLWQL
jgi:hypothetical protein